jgi:putative tricarboxylic transport membrane protein
MDPALVKFWDDAIQKLVASDGWKAMVKEMFLRSEVVPASQAKEHMAKLHKEHHALLSDLGLAK